MLRAGGQVQFGRDPAIGFILGGLRSAEAEWLAALGVGRVDDVDQLRRSAAALGVTPARSAVLLRLLQRRGVLCDPAAMDTGTADGTAADGSITGPPSDPSGSQRPFGRSRPLRCEVPGDSHLAAMLTDHLREIPGVALLDQCRDAGSAGTGPADLSIVLLAAFGALRPMLITGPADTDARRILPVVTGQGVATVGPVLRASPRPEDRCAEPLGWSSAELCPGCLDRYLDSAAPADAALPQGPAETDALPAPVPIDLAAAAVAMTTRVVGLLAGGRPVPAGLSWEWDGSWPSVAVRQWRRHPLCRCAD